MFRFTDTLLRSGNRITRPFLAEKLFALMIFLFLGSTLKGLAQAPTGNVIISTSTTWPTGTYQVTSLTVNSGATLTVGGGSSVTVSGAVLVTASANIVLESINNTAQVNGKWQGAGVTINAASVEVDSGSSINADGQGYVPNAGPGGSPVGSYDGGSYGGLGAIQQYPTAVASPIYGSSIAPVDLGSGGDLEGTSTGASGGGAIYLSVSGTLTNNGVISANGASPSTTGGSGSGGSVYVQTSALAGSGTFLANGGSGLQNGAYGGGGGRVAVYYNGGSSTFTGFATSTASGGQGSYTPGANGTSGFFDTSTADEGLSVYQNFVLPPSTAVTYNSVTVQAGAVLTIGGGSTINVDTALKVTGTLVAAASNNTAQVKGTWQGAGVTINAASVQVDSTGSLNADTQGYVPAAGPGGAPSGTNPGASYGGLGGSVNGYASPPTYGSPTVPTDLGSGGSSTNGTVNGSDGGAGGGAIKLTVSGTLTNNGIISANGQGPGATNNQASGGSGGSVFIRTGTLAGSGSIQANGGAGYYAGGGGGGRIAVYYTTNSGFNLDLVTANGGVSGVYGAPGTVYTLGANTNLTVSDNVVLPANANLTYSSVTVNNTGSITLGAGTTLTAASISVSSGSSFNVGGGSTVTVSGAVVVTGNSSIVFDSINNTAQVNGTVRGAGATLTAGSVEVDAGSSINADAQGYAPTAGPGGTPLGTNPGASYGGLGGAPNGYQPPPTYGLAVAPTDLGSGGSSTNGTVNGSAGGAGGGAARLIVLGTLTNNGVISSNGQGPGSANNQASGGSGGSVLIQTATLTGSGTIVASGGTGYYGGGGGGGRVAVYYTTDTGFNVTQVTAPGGGGGTSGANGSVVFTNTPAFAWIAPVGSVLHGTQTLEWFAGVVDPTTTTVKLVASGPDVETIASGLNANASLSLDTTTLANGRYEFRLIFYDANGNDIQEVPRTFVINNSLAWHSGIIASNQEWTANQVQGIDGTVVIPSGVTVTIDPGTIVKATPGSKIIVQPGGILNALGGASNPVIFTTFDDSRVGGDTDFTGGLTAPTPGEWNGITVQTGGQFNTNANTEILYVESSLSGTLSASQTLQSDQVYQVNGILNVPSGIALTIQPGTVVKFAANAGISVQPGGQLIANGTLVQPIYFTSLNDSSVGGNTSGSAQAPAPGDWSTILIDGATATFNHVYFLYGGGPQSSSSLLGMIQTSDNANVTISNSVISQSFYNGILTGYPNGGGTLTLTSTVVSGVEDRAIDAFPGSTVNVTNDTFDANNSGIQVHGGTVNVANTIISNTIGTQLGAVYFYQGALNISYSDVWTSAAGVPNYSGIADPTGTNGNISANPVYVNQSQGDYRLNFGSPALDAANGAVSPLTDALGDPRYNDPRVQTRAGVPDANGHYPDMGAFEYVESAASDIDLTVPSVSGPATAITGTQVQLTWTDTNTGSGTAQGPWHDAIYLVQDPDTNPVAIYAGDVLVASGVTLGPGASVVSSGTIRVPGTTVGNHRWEVKANDRGEVFVGQNSANATGISLNEVAIDLPELVVDSPATSNTFASTGQSAWYKLTPGANKAVEVTLDLTGASGAVQLFVGQGYLPTPQHYDFQQIQFNSTTASLVIPSTSSQTYYVTAYAQLLTTSPALFTLAATTIKFSLTSVSPNAIINSGSQTLMFVGGGFQSNATYQLVAPGGQTYTATSVFLTDASHAAATFAASGLANGIYGAQVMENGTTVSLSNAVAVGANSSGSSSSVGGQIQVNLSTPFEYRVGFPFEATLNYTNVSGSDLPAPMILVSATGATLAEIPPPCSSCNANFPLMYQSQNSSTSLLVLGISNQGPAGVLPAGASGSIPLLVTVGVAQDVTLTTQVVSTANPDPLIGYTVSDKDCPPLGCPVSGSVKAQAKSRASVSPNDSAAQTTTSIGNFADADAFCSDFIPPFANAAGFSRTCMQLLVGSGYQANPTTTVAPYEYVNLDSRNVNRLLAADATALSSQGVYEYDGGRLLGFELENDGYNTFNQRYHQGAFGFGTSHTYDITAETVGGINVVLYPDGFARTFPTPNASKPNQYLGKLGDYGTLTVGTDGTWTVTESDGVVYHFILDPQANATNRQLLDYIQDLNGNRITMTYTNDLVTSATDNFGNNYSYVYDSLGHITQATDPVGRVTTYTYDIKSDSLHSTFLTSVTDAGGTTAISWNEGGPSGVGYFSDSCASSYCEPAIGVNTITYPDGTHTYYTYDALGRLASTYRDGETENITYSYGSGGVVTKTDANGNVSQSVPNEFGDLLQYVDPLGSVLKIAYDPENKVTGLLEPLGANTSIGYDSQGNVSSYIDPLGNQQSQSFAPYNNLQSYTSPSGNLLQFNYDSHYNPVAAVYPDGTATHATYDSAGNLTSFTNRRGHTITYVYNAQNLLIAKTYSGGTQLAFTYDAHRNLATVSAANGMTSYTYDSADRPTGISFPNGQSIQYTYNSGGQRSSMTDSTGFSVKYTYDAAGRLSQLSSGSGSSIVSYAYDASGRLSSKTLGNGVLTSYTYDGAGNLLHIANSSSGGATISQFDYTYDALGRRITTNAPAGAGSYGYDADGEVTSATLPGGTAAYTFDADGNRTAGSGLSYSVNNLDQYTSAGTASYSYDADGNLISGAGWTYTYDDDNRLISMVDATDTWTYQYDGLGNRVSTTHNGITTQYLNDLSGDGNVEAELTASGQVISHFTYGLDLTSSVPASGFPAYYHFDGAGNTVQMTDSSGSVVNSYSYLPFGEKIASTAGISNPFTYVGEYGVMDDGSGLYFMRNRSYSPVLGRFVQLDPLGLAGGSANLYSYTGNNPITQVDPLGTEDEPTRDLLNETFNQVNHTNVDTVDSTATRQATQDRVINGAKEQAVETIVTIAAPEVEISENKVLKFAFNKYFPHKLLEKGIDHSLGIKEPEEPSEPGSEEPGHKSEPPSSPHPGDLVPPDTPGGSKNDPGGASIDPNGKLTSGYGDQGFVPPNTPILYTIYFENQPTATAPAEEVVVTDPLAANLDWSTVQLSQIQFNNFTINVPSGQQTYTGQVSVSTDPDPVSVNASLNPSTGVLSWTMQSVNPTTGGLPADPLAGFLPPNNASNQGTGYVTFTVKPKSGLSNGTAITNQASIVFDANAPISTNTVTNTIDSVDPTSSVGALPATTTSPSFTVTWSGSDPAGAGIASYNIFVSINNGAYSVWQASTTATSATYSGVAGLTYSFYSIATDNAGNIQLAPGPIQTTTITAQALASQTITFGPLANQTYGVAAISLIATASSGLPVAYTVTGPATVSGATLTITGAGLVTVTASQAGNNAYAAATSVSQSFTIAKATLTATATNVTRVYGAVNPALTYSLGGFVNSDTSAVVSGSATLSTTATMTSAPGPYPITFATEALAATNYTFNYVAGVLTVSGGAYQTITFSALLNQTYGTASLTLAATASSGLPMSYTVNGPATISGSILTVTGAGLVTVTASQAGNADYAAATPVSQSFTVAKAVLTATAASLSRIYGVANPALTYSVAGFVNGDTIAIVSGSATLSTTASATSSAGTYPITFTTEALAATNYSFNYVAGVLTISGGASQTISFGPLVGKTYGVAPLTLTATASSGLPVSYTTTGPATVSGSTLTITGAGLVIVTASQTGNTHYAAAMPVSQSLTVAKAVLTATAASVSRPYGAANPALTYSVAGFVKGDKTSVVSGSATPTTTATATSAPGTYPITFATEGLVAANYSFTYVAGTLTVSSGTLVVAPSSWNFGSVTVGRISPVISFTVTNNTTSTMGYLGYTNLGEFYLQPGTCHLVNGEPMLNPGKSCVFTAFFKPTKPGAVSGNLSIQTSSGTFNVPMTGTGSTLVISPASGNFGSIVVGKTSAAISFTVTNDTTSTMGYLGYTNLGEFYLQPGTCHLVNGEPMLNPGQSCVFTAVFQPTKVGAVSGELSIQTSSGTFNVPMTGTGVTQ